MINQGWETVSQETNEKVWKAKHELFSKRAASKSNKRVDR